MATRSGSGTPELGRFRVARAGSGRIGRAVRAARRDAGGADPIGPALEVRWAMAERLADALDGALRSDDLGGVVRLSRELDMALAKVLPGSSVRLTGGPAAGGDGDSLDREYADLCGPELGD